MSKEKFSNFFLFILLFTIGTTIRTIHFPENPPGFNQDEANSGYETYSLLETGKDKWGNVWPAYFPSWGSGQNVLMAYLSIPVVKIFGLNVFAVRLVPLILGILSLPLFFFCLQPLGRFTSFLGLFLLSVVPWHFMLSRWALESNLLPFFMLLGCFTLMKALSTNQKKWIIPSLLPFAFALYAYGTTILILPVFFGLILFFHFKQLRLHASQWLTAFALFIIIAFPFIIYFIENYLLKRNLAWTDHLFFSTPICPSNRLDQVNASLLEIIQKNVDFLIAECNDESICNNLPGYKIMLDLIVPFSILGLIIGGYKLFRRRKNKTIFSNSAFIVVSIFFAWGIAALSFLGIFELNVNRFNHFYLPCLAISVWLIYFITEKINSIHLKNGIRLMIVLLILFSSSLAVKYYFSEYPKGRIKADFNVGLKEAFARVEKLSSDQILITNLMPLPYVYTLFYLQYPPDKFREEVYYEIKDGEYKVRRFGKYVFTDQLIDHNKPYGYLTRNYDSSKDNSPERKIFYTDEFWEVSIIR